MSDETKLRIVGKIGTELDEERSKVLINTVEIVLVHHCRGLHNPGIAFVGFGIVSLFGPVDGALLLSFADENNALRFMEFRPALVCNIVLALSLLKTDHGNVMILRILLDGAHKSAGHRLHSGRG